MGPRTLRAARLGFHGGISQDRFQYVATLRAHVQISNVKPKPLRIARRLRSQAQTWRRPNTPSLPSPALTVRIRIRILTTTTPTKATPVRLLGRKSGRRLNRRNRARQQRREPQRRSRRSVNARPLPILAPTALPWLLLPLPRRPPRRRLRPLHHRPRRCRLLPHHHRRDRRDRLRPL